MGILSSPLVSTDTVHAHLPQLKTVDASWYMPAEHKSGEAIHRQTHLPDAVFFDIDHASERQSPLPHMLPTAEAFARYVASLGISNEDEVVVYDQMGLFSAARVWWMFRVFGHANVAVMDGGLPKWQRENRPTTHAETVVQPAHFTARFTPALLRRKEDVLQNLTTQQALVLDARSPARFSGEEKDPRAGVASGHIPASQCAHFRSLLNADGTVKPETELRKLLHSAGGKPVISSCGSGVTACIIDLCLELTGHRNHAVYDGSWAEWGGDAHTPKSSQS